MRLFVKLAAVALAACSFATAASAASYNMSCVATNASNGSFTGTGDVGASLLVGDSVTITLTAGADANRAAGRRPARRRLREPSSRTLNACRCNTQGRRWRPFSLTASIPLDGDQSENGCCCFATWSQQGGRVNSMTWRRWPLPWRLTTSYWSALSRGWSRACQRSCTPSELRATGLSPGIPLHVYRARSSRVDGRLQLTCCGLAPASNFSTIGWNLMFARSLPAQARRP
jgi:hypothetical protein